MPMHVLYSKKAKKVNVHVQHNIVYLRFELPFLITALGPFMFFLSLSISPTYVLVCTVLYI